VCTVPRGGKWSLFRSNHPSYVLCGKRAAPRRISDKDVMAENKTRAGNGCDRTRAAIKGSVKEITFEKSF